METYTSAFSTRRGLLAWIPLAILATLGLGAVSTVITVVSSLFTFPLTGRLDFETNGFEQFNALLLMIYLIAVYGLNLAQRAGVLMLGHGLYFLVGAYVSATLQVRTDVPFWLAFTCGVLSATIVGVLTALPSIRLTQFTFAVLTIGMAMAGQELAFQWRSVTGGGEGLMGVTFPPSVTTAEGYYWVVLGFLLLTLLVTRNLIRSRFGRWAGAVAEGGPAAISIGVHPGAIRVQAVGVAAAFAGLAGALYAPLIGVLTPEAFGVNLSILFILMVLLGGAGTVLGPLLGALILFRIPIAVTEVAPDAADVSLLLYAVVLLLSVWLFPRGLVTLWWLVRRKVLGPTRQGRSAPPTASAVKTQFGSPLALELSGVSKHIRGVTILEGVSMEVPQGQIRAVIGPNGAGKTSLLNVVSGLMEPDAGQVRLADADVTDLSTTSRTRIGLARTFQTPLLIEDMSALENVMCALDSHQQTRFSSIALGSLSYRRAERASAEDAMSLLATVELDRVALSAAHALTPGQRRRLELARALALQPGLLLLDEPAGGLDSSEIADLERVLRLVRDSGVSCLVVEHHLDLVHRIADVVTVMDFGKVIFEGTPEAASNDSRVVAAYIGSVEETTTTSLGKAEL